MKPAEEALRKGLAALHLEAPASVVEDLTRLVDAALKEAANDPEERLWDLLTSEDGQSAKEAEKYLKEKRPDLPV